MRPGARGLQDIQSCDQAHLTQDTAHCCEATTRSTKVGYLIYLDNSGCVSLVLILSYIEDESMLLV